MNSQPRQLSPRPFVPQQTAPPPSLTQEPSKKKRKPALHPPPGWKDDNWRFTRKLLQLLLEPENDNLRRALWPRVGETLVGGSKIEYQTELAKKTFERWEHEEHVRDEPRWYGNRIKDYMHKLPRVFIECEKELRDPKDSSEDTWTQEKRFQAILLRCPVYNELSQLLSGTGALHLPPPPPAHIPSVFQLPTRPNTLDSTLDLVETFLPPLERQLAVASGSGAVPRRGTGIERTPSPVAPRLLSEGWVSGATQGSETTSVRKRGKAKREREESISSDDSFDSDTERLAPSARAALKQRKRDQYHQRALRRDEMEYERAMEVGKEKVREREREEREREREREEREREREERKEEREFELRKLELGLQLAKAQGRLGV